MDVLLNAGYYYQIREVQLALFMAFAEESQLQSEVFHQVCNFWSGYQREFDVRKYLGILF